MEKTEDPTERRALSRRTYTHPIGFELRKMESGLFENIQARGQGVDICAGGFCLLTEIPMKTGDVLKAALPILPPDTAVPVFSRVQWARRENDQYRVGVQFLT
jgi:hypothetical protein